jgi:hypothetical protein
MPSPTLPGLISCCFPCVVTATVQADIEERECSIFDACCAPNAYVNRQSMRAKYTMEPAEPTDAVTCCLYVGLAVFACPLIIPWRARDPSLVSAVVCDACCRVRLLCIHLMGVSTPAAGARRASSAITCASLPHGPMAPPATTPRPRSSRPRLDRRASIKESTSTVVVVQITSRGQLHAQWSNTTAFEIYLDLVESYM